MLIRDRGYLPHWERDAGLYFITFRLADSLPEHVAKTSRDERRRIEANPDRQPDNILQELRVAYHRRFEAALDRGLGSCALRNPQIAEVMAAALHHWHGSRYNLVCWCVMPNHVHTVVRLHPGIRLGEVVHSWKSFTAKQANRTLRRTGPFWQREYFDHLIRPDELDRTVAYVLDNPAKAGLRRWEWVGEGGQDARRPAGEDAGATR